MKIKEKFMEKSQPDSGDMTLLAFLELFATAKLNEVGLMLVRRWGRGSFDTSTTAAAKICLSGGS